MNKQIFIVGTGRSGTKAFATALNGYHEYGIKYNKTSKISTLFNTTDPFFQDPFINNTYLNEWIIEYHLGIDDMECFINSDNTYCFFLDTLYTLYPESKILHIVRDGRDTAPSMLKRGWHTYKNLGHYPMLNDSMHDEYYTSFSDLQKVAWIWKDRISKINEASKNFSNDRYRAYRIEDCSDTEIIHEIQNYLNINFDSSKLFTNINSNILDKSNYKEYWSDKQLDEYNEIAYNELKYFNYV